MRRIATIALTGLAVLALPVAASADNHSSTTYAASLDEANDSGASADVHIEVDGNMADITIDGEGFFDGFPHAMHIHGEPGGDNVCPPAMNPGDDGFDAVDEDGDGILSVAEGAPFYGGITVSLTTEGDTSPDSGLAVDRFPTSGTLDYSRTIELPQEVADDLSSLHVVVHGLDLDDTGEVGDLDIPSSIDPELPIEATAPAACGQITAMAAGGVDTGAGGAATAPADTAAMVAGATALGTLGLLTVRRVRQRASA